MSGPRAAVRITLAAEQLEDGWVTMQALREVRALLADVPAAAPVVLDLGPLTRVDDGLVHSLALLPCSRQVRLESPRWWVAHETAIALTLLLPAEVAHG